jgi:hypothetical protein
VVNSTRDTPRIEEWAVDHVDKMTAEAKESYNVNLTADGDVEHYWIDKAIVPANRRNEEVQHWNRVFHATSYVSKEHALKLAAEKRQEWLREQVAVHE